MTHAEAEAVLHRFGVHSLVRLEPAVGGKIHETVFVDAPNGRLVLQRVSPPFDERSARDVAAVTSFLAKEDFPSPRILRADSGEPFVRVSGSLFRLMERMPGGLRPMFGPSEAYEAGRLTGRLHVLLEKLSHRPEFSLEGVHDPPTALRKLFRAAERNAGKKAQVSDLLEVFAREITSRPLPKDLPLRSIHGDLKTTNFLWGETGAPTALLDYDTFKQGNYPMEMADAFRSWCGTNNAPDGPGFSLGKLRAGWRGYLETAPPWSRVEVTSLAAAIPLIFLELGARYLADFFEECYFAWDPSKFESRAAHNLHRAHLQWNLFLQTTNQDDEIREILHV